MLDKIVCVATAFTIGALLQDDKVATEILFHCDSLENSQKIAGESSNIDNFTSDY
ncbi:MAG: hypothetical protein HRU36_03820 [Rickettsiales bacterium]|nr:hypothetical protein [Rickettsiales bacterium]